MLPNGFYTAVSFLSGMASALCITFLIHLRPHMIPTIPAMDFVVLGLFLGPILEESVFRGFLLPMLARTLGDVASLIATAVLFAAFHGPGDVTHWVWFSTTGLAYGLAPFGVSHDHRSRVHACGVQSDSVPYCQILIREHVRVIAMKFTPEAWMQAVQQVACFLNPLD